MAHRIPDIIDCQGEIHLQTLVPHPTALDLPAWDIALEQEWDDQGRLRHTVTFSCPATYFRELSTTWRQHYVWALIWVVGRDNVKIGDAYQPLRVVPVVVRTGLGDDFQEAHVEVRLEG